MSKKNLNWIAFGQIFASIVSLFTIIRNALSALSVGPEIIEWLVGEDKEVFIKEFLNPLGEKFLASQRATIVNLDADPMIPDGWTIEEHTKGGQFEWDPAKVALYLSQGQKNGRVVGNKLRKKLEGKGVYNANLLDFLLAHPELIPDEWEGKFIFFWGTIYRNSNGSLYVRCLSWIDDGWYWNYNWFDSDFGDGNPAAISASN